ncbi:ATP-binding cassette domain-containing protein [Novosphingobium umbonatum]|nr:ATP-binding cassette domain-containing protein [Novosphingobium umbonatum]
MALLPAQSAEGFAARRGALSGLPALLLTSFFLAFGPVVLALFVLLVFDVALPGHSVPTLMSMGGLALLLLVARGILAGLRRHTLGHMAQALLSPLLPRLDEATALLAQAGKGGDADQTQIARDVDSLRGFLAHGEVEPWLDLAALPLTLLVLLMMHGALALATLLGAATMVFILWRAMRLERDKNRDLLPLIGRRHAVMAASMGRADVIRALGLGGKARAAWHLANQRLFDLLIPHDKTGARLQTIARGLMMATLVAVTVVGGWLEIAGHASAAVVVASAACSLAALLPLLRCVERAQALASAEQAWSRLDMVLASVPAPAPKVGLPTPSATFSCEGLAVAPAGARKPLVQGISFHLEAGQVLTVVGPGGVGKSALLRTLTGGWTTPLGQIRLDGATLDQWDAAALGRHIGYLPQNIELLDGTVAENMSGFDPDANPQDIIQAAQDAGIHEMILALPDGYATWVGAEGRRLSQSQAQRIGLARALYGRPFLLVLDEPTAHQDTGGERQLAMAVAAARERGAVVVLAGAAGVLVGISTHVLVLQNGKVLDYGTRDAVRERAQARRQPSVTDKPASGPANGQAPNADQSDSGESKVLS